MGVPGSGKSYLGRLLQERGVGTYRELEPLLREKFGSGAEFNARIREAGAFVWRSYQEQLAEDGPTPVFESAGVDDRPLLELLEKQHSIAFVHVEVSRDLCVERVVSRPARRNINPTNDRERVARYYDIWYSKVFPTYRFALTVSGDDAAAACAAIGALLGG
jgi:hypothetical protein